MLPLAGYTAVLFSGRPDSAGDPTEQACETLQGYIRQELRSRVQRYLTPRGVVGSLDPGNVMRVPAFLSGLSPNTRMHSGRCDHSDASQRLAQISQNSP